MHDEQKIKREKTVWCKKISKTKGKRKDENWYIIHNKHENYAN